MRSLLCLLALTACATAPIAMAPTGSPTPLPWLQGCWVTEDGNTVERWQGEADTLMFGHSVTVKEGAVTFFEQLRIQAGDDGLIYSAYPRGKGPIDFQQVIADDQRVTFANDTHDFPQRITYTRDGDVISAAVSLKDGGRAFRWRYTPCD